MGILLNWLHRTMLVVGVEIGRLNGGGIHTLEGNPNSGNNKQKGKSHLHKNFSLADLQSIFATWAIGTAFSFVAFASELLWQNYQNSSQNV